MEREEERGEREREREREREGGGGGGGDVGNHNLTPRDPNGQAVSQSECRMFSRVNVSCRDLFALP